MQRQRSGDSDGEGEGDGAGCHAKKARVVWSVEMHQQFVNAVNTLGVDSASFTPPTTQGLTLQSHHAINPEQLLTYPEYQRHGFDALPAGM